MVCMTGPPDRGLRAGADWPARHWLGDTDSGVDDDRPPRTDDDRIEVQFDDGGMVFRQSRDPQQGIFNRGNVAGWRSAIPLQKRKTAQLAQHGRGIRSREWTQS